jgi:putative chitinase
MNKESFYIAYRKVFGDIKKEQTVLCIDAILDEFDKAGVKINSTEKLAYALATVRHECGSEMLPITENLNYSIRRLRQVWPSRFPTAEQAKPYANDPERLGNKVYGGRLGNGVFEGYKYRGRGFVQITGYDNYKKFSQLLNVDLNANPDLAKDIKIGAKILVVGMIEGMFTGRKLSGYINSGKIDYFNARDIINADKARVGSDIEADAKKFEQIIKYSLTS